MSLVSIFQELRIPTTENIPTDAQAAIQWDALAVWGRTPEDQGRTFEQDLMLIAPDGSMTAHTKRQFPMTTRQHRIISKMYGFPVSQSGEYSLVLKLKDIDNERVLVLEASYPMFVIHESKTAPAP